MHYRQLDHWQFFFFFPPPPIHSRLSGALTFIHIYIYTGNNGNQNQWKDPLTLNTLLYVFFHDNPPPFCITSSCPQNSIFCADSWHYLLLVAKGMHFLKFPFHKSVVATWTSSHLHSHCMYSPPPLSISSVNLTRFEQYSCKILATVWFVAYIRHRFM